MSALPPIMDLVDIKALFPAMPAHAVHRDGDRVAVLSAAGPCSGCAAAYTTGTFEQIVTDGQHHWFRLKTVHDTAAAAPCKAVHLVRVGPDGAALISLLRGQSRLDETHGWLNAAARLMAAPHDRLAAVMDNLTGGLWGDTPRGAQDALAWSVPGWTPEHAHEAARVDFSAHDAADVHEVLPMPPERMIAWAKTARAEGFGQRLRWEILSWAYAGITDPHERAPGVGSVQTRYLANAGLPLTEEWAALWGERVCPDVAAACHAASRTPHDAQRLHAALGQGHRGGDLHAHLYEAAPGAKPPETTVNCGWEADLPEPVVAMVQSLDFEDVLACLTAGMTPAETREHLTAGRDMEPVKVVAAFVADPST